ncbi:MAG: hypothetical protein JTT12_07860 [Candidatus Brockarchaeota archaeon]|nr:hypothetical protein [Candidatus Brockarchaeota archaeon]
MKRIFIMFFTLVLFFTFVILVVVVNFHAKSYEEESTKARRGEVVGLYQEKLERWIEVSSQVNDKIFYEFEFNPDNVTLLYSDDPEYVHTENFNYSGYVLWNSNLYSGKNLNFSYYVYHLLIGDGKSYRLAFVAHSSNGVESEIIVNARGAEYGRNYIETSEDAIYKWALERINESEKTVVKISGGETRVLDSLDSPPLDETGYLVQFFGELKIVRGSIRFFVVVYNPNQTDSQEVIRKALDSGQNILKSAFICKGKLPRRGDFPGERVWKIYVNPDNFNKAFLNYPESAVSSYVHDAGVNGRDYTGIFNETGGIFTNLGYYGILDKIFIIPLGDYKAVKNRYLSVQIYAPSYNAPGICPNVLAIAGIAGKDYYSSSDEAVKFNVDTSLPSKPVLVLSVYDNSTLGKSSWFVFTQVGGQCLGGWKLLFYSYSSRN